MAEIEKLTQEQFDLAKVVEKSLTNLKKDAGKIRRSSPEARAETIKKKRAELEANWSTFSQRHSVILSIETQEHDYFEQKFYNQVHELFSQYEKYLKELEAATTPIQQTTESSGSSGQEKPHVQAAQLQAAQLQAAQLQAAKLQAAQVQAAQVPSSNFILSCVTDVGSRQ